MMSDDSTVQVCDATYDAMKNQSRVNKISQSKKTLHEKKTGVQRCINEIVNIFLYLNNLDKLLMIF